MTRTTRQFITIPRMLALLAGVVVACVVFTLASIFLRPPVFASFSEAVGYKLQQRGIAYNQIYIDRAWPDTVNDITYGANLVIRVEGRDDIIGRLDCRGWQRDCFFTIRSFGIDRESLPELSQQQRLPWVAWAEKTLGEWAPQW